MTARKSVHKPPQAGGPTGAETGPRSDRYRPLPSGSHGVDPGLVKHNQRERLQKAMIELIAEKGYPAVRIADLAKLAHVSQATFYSLFADKEDLFLGAYDEVAGRTVRAVVEAYGVAGSHAERLAVAMRAWSEIAAAEPEAISLLVLGAFGAGSSALERRRHVLDELERRIYASRDGTPDGDSTDLMVKASIGGICEVTVTRLRDGRAGELPGLADKLTAWATCYPRRLPPGLGAPPTRPRESGEGAAVLFSERARRAEGRLPSGRCDLPRQFIVKSQRERIVDATAAIVAEKGLAALTIPEIARRANVSHQTFYDIYDSKHDAFLGAQKAGMHQALAVAVDAYQAQQDDWPQAARAGIRALLEYLASEPAHAHLSVVETFAAYPETLEIRDATLAAFATYFEPAYELARGHVEVPAIAGEAIAGGIWQVIRHYVENDCTAELPGAAAQLTYFALTPFLGQAAAAKIALGEPARRPSRRRHAPAAPDPTPRDFLPVEHYDASGGSSAVPQLAGGLEVDGTRLQAEITELEDDDLVAAAFEEFWETFGNDETISAFVRARVLKDLEEAEAQLRDEIVLSREGRGRLRRFLFNAQLRNGGR
jgi:AcrR family transcriptional regulator